MQKYTTIFFAHHLLRHLNESARYVVAMYHLQAAKGYPDAMRPTSSVRALSPLLVMLEHITATPLARALVDYAVSAWELTGKGPYNCKGGALISWNKVKDIVHTLAAADRGLHTMLGAEHKTTELNAFMSAGDLIRGPGAGSHGESLKIWSLESRNDAEYRYVAH